jgi:hypothetical protein
VELLPFPCRKQIINTTTCWNNIQNAEIVITSLLAETDKKFGLEILEVVGIG